MKNRKRKKQVSWLGIDHRGFVDDPARSGMPNTAAAHLLSCARKEREKKKRQRVREERREGETVGGTGGAGWGGLGWGGEVKARGGRACHEIEENKGIYMRGVGSGRDYLSPPPTRCSCAPFAILRLSAERTAKTATVVGNQREGIKRTRANRGARL